MRCNDLGPCQALLRPPPLRRRVAVDSARPLQKAASRGGTRARDPPPTPVPGRSGGGRGAQGSSSRHPNREPLPRRRPAADPAPCHATREHNWPIHQGERQCAVSCVAPPNGPAARGRAPQRCCPPATTDPHPQDLHEVALRIRGRPRKLFVFRCKLEPGNTGSPTRFTSEATQCDATDDRQNAHVYACPPTAPRPLGARVCGNDLASLSCQVSHECVLRHRLGEYTGRVVPTHYLTKSNSGRSSAPRIQISAVSIWPRTSYRLSRSWPEHPREPLCERRTPQARLTKLQLPFGLMGNA